VLICSERKVLMADWIAGGWFVLKEKYRWLVAVVVPKWFCKLQCATEG
jgi:hypothetical protein